MSDENKSSNAPPWRTETWRLTHGPEGDRQTRWFLARQDDPAMPTLSPQGEASSYWSITEPSTPHFLAMTRSPEEGVAYMASVSRAIDPVIEKLDPGNPDDLRAEINYLRSREAYFASVLKVADGGQYRADWKAPLQRVLDENKVLHDEVDALRDGQESVRLALVSALCEGTGDLPAIHEGHEIASMIRDLGRWVKWQNGVIDDQAKQQDNLADQNNALRGEQEAARLALVECLRAASNNPPTSPEARAMPTAALAKDLLDRSALPACEAYRAERERDDLTAQRDAARADHAAAEAHLAGIVSRWEAADHDSQNLADIHIPGLRAEIEEARDGREGEWWEVSRG